MSTGHVGEQIDSGYVCGTNTNNNSELDPQVDLQEEGSNFPVTALLCNAARCFAIL